MLSITANTLRQQLTNTEGKDLGLCFLYDLPFGGKKSKLTKGNGYCYIPAIFNPLCFHSALLTCGCRSLLNSKFSSFTIYSVMKQWHQHSKSSMIPHTTILVTLKFVDHMIQSKYWDVFWILLLIHPPVRPLSSPAGEEREGSAGGLRRGHREEIAAHHRAPCSAGGGSQ